MSEINSVGSSFLARMTDAEIRAKVETHGAKLIKRVFPGQHVEANNLPDALIEAGASFEVRKDPLMVVHSADAAGEVETHKATVRVDTNAVLGVVGADYGVVQTLDAFRAVGILAERGDIALQNVEVIGGGARVRVTGLLGVTSLLSADGAPNTLCHYGMFSASHDGNSSVTSWLYTLRVECFNGMTSRKLIGAHTLRHTSLVGKRVEEYATTVLADLLGDVEAERAVFSQLINRRLGTGEFGAFAVTLLGGPLADDASQSMRTRRDNAVEELIGYFVGGNQGAGPTAWGAYNSVTRWIEGKREGIADAAKAAKKFASNTDGNGNATIARALRLLTR